MGNSLTRLNDQLYLSSNKQHLMLMVLPLDDKITETKLTELISQSDYATFKINPVGMKQAIISFSKLQGLTTSPTDIKPIVIADRIDAQLTINIDPLKLSAKAEIISAYGGQPITLDLILEKIKGQDITYGLSQKMIHLLIQKSKKAAPGTLYQAVIAKGDNPINGYNATFERLVETPSERIMKPQKKENGKVDMRDLGKLVAVKPGTPLMRKIPHLEGTPGTTITGEPIKNLVGKDLSLNVGDHTELDPNDNCLLISIVAGVPHEISNGMRVDDALIIKNVDVGFGHVNYEGDVIITGDICDGMKIKASGNITVAGFVESAYIECDGDLSVGKGILGRKRNSEGANFSCEIDCKGSVTATFSQYTRMHVGKDLRIKNQLLHCIVYCQGHISIQNDFGNKGVVLGGLLCANKGLSAVVIGSPAGTKTSIDLTGNYRELVKEKQRIEEQIPEEKAKLHSVFESQQLIAGAPPTEKRKSIDARLTSIQEEVNSKLLVLVREQEDNLVAIQEYITHSKVIALQKFYSQISITSNDDVFDSKSSYGPTCVSIHGEKLIAEPHKV